MMVVIGKQLNDLVKKKPPGIKMIINDTDLLDIQADIIGPEQTPYEGGQFRCKLVIQSDFPRSAPKGFFLTKIFHPNVSDKGEICVNTLKKDWNPAAWSFQNIFEVIRCLLIVPFPESALNEEAGKIFMENYDEYFKRAKIYTDIYALSKEKYQQNNVQQQQQQLINQQLSNIQYQNQQQNSNGKQNSQQYQVIKENMSSDFYQQQQPCQTHKENDRSRDYFTKFTPTKQENLLLENNSNMMQEELQPKSDQKNSAKGEQSGSKTKLSIPINLTFTSSFTISTQTQIYNNSNNNTTQYPKKENDKKKWLKRI